VIGLEVGMSNPAILIPREREISFGFLLLEIVGAPSFIYTQSRVAQSAISP
jgi:hypothetical protein